MRLIILLLISFAHPSCDGKPAPSAIQNSSFADITNVVASGSSGDYQFRVTISSPDTSCDQYADWWEVISESGDLLYRRILLHSHVNEQPFTRTGGKIITSENEVIWIRAHMNNTGYGGTVLKGSVKSGFTKTKPSDSFGEDLDQVQPLPNGCNF